MSLAIALTVSACGGGSDDSSAGTTQTTGASEELKKMKIVVGRQPLGGGSTAITRQMLKTGLLEEVGREFGYDLQVDWRDFPNAGPIMELLKSGPQEMSFAFVGNTPVMTGIVQDLPLQVITTGEGTQPFFLLVRPDSDIQTLEDLEGKTVGTLVGLDPQNAFIQLLEAELGKTPEELGIKFQNFPELPVLASLPAGIDAAAMVPWSPAYKAIEEGKAVALVDTRGITGDAHELGAGERLPGVAKSSFSPEGYYQFRPFWIAHREIFENEPDLVLAFLVAYQRGLDQIRELGAEAVAEQTATDWGQPVDVGVSIIEADLLWNRGWVWLTEGDFLTVVCASKPLVAAGNLPSEVTLDVVKEHMAGVADLQEEARRLTNSAPDEDFEREDSELTDLRGLPVWQMDEWGRYEGRC